MRGKVQRNIRRTGIVLGCIPLLIFIPIWNIFFFIYRPLGEAIAWFLIYSVFLVPVAMIMGLVDLGMTISNRRKAKKAQ